MRFHHNTQHAPPLGYKSFKYVGGLQFRFGISFAIHGFVSDCCVDVFLFGLMDAGVSED